MDKKCQICNKELDENQRKNCSKKCADRAYYNAHKEKINTRTRQWAINHPEIAKISSKKGVQKFREKNKERFNKLVLKGYYKHSERWKARAQARNKIPISKEAVCEQCKAHKKLERHHPDYKRPLDVILLCRSCHEKAESIILKRQKDLTPDTKGKVRRKKLNKIKI